MAEERIRENEAYLNSLPDVRNLLTEFVLAVLKEKPKDVKAFARKHFSNSEHMNGNGSVATQMNGTDLHAPLVIVGPSGVGKGTLIARLMQEFSSEFGFSVSHTTRKPREGEVHGKHYYFTNHDEVRKHVAEGRFIEHAEVHGNIYGTSHDAVRNVQQSGKVCIFDIDVQGMEALKKTSLKPNTLFIKPPSHEELERRLRNRGTESEEAIQKRLSNAQKELLHLEKPGVVHQTIINDDLEETYLQLKKQILKWYPHLIRD